MKNQTWKPTEFSDSYYKVGNSEAIVQYMHELQNSGVRDTAPDIVTYKTVIREYARVVKNVYKEAPLKAKKVVRDMIYLRNNINPIIAPYHRSYNPLISDWVKTKQLNSAEISD